jgi:AraC-like DNA-binding protein
MSYVELSIEMNRHLETTNTIRTRLGYPHPDRIMESHDVLFMLSGEWEVMEEEKVFYLKPGNILFLFAGRHHFGNQACTTDAEWIYFHIVPHEEDRYIDETVLQPTDSQRIVLPQLMDVRQDCALFQSLFVEVMKLNASQQMLQQQKARTSCTSLLIELARYSQEQQHIQDVTMLELALFLEANLQKNYSLAELAQHSGVSERMLTKRFKKQMNKSVNQFVADLRINKAFFLLQHYPDMRIKELAYLLGFYDEYHFSRTFKSKSNYSPRHFRDHIRNNKVL